MERPKRGNGNACASAEGFSAGNGDSGASAEYFRNGNAPSGAGAGRVCAGNGASGAGAAHVSNANGASAAGAEDFQNEDRRARGGAAKLVVGIAICANLRNLWINRLCFFCSAISAALREKEFAGAGAAAAMPLRARDARSSFVKIREDSWAKKRFAVKPPKAQRSAGSGSADRRSPARRPDRCRALRACACRPSG